MLYELSIFIEEILMFIIFLLFFIFAIGIWNYICNPNWNGNEREKTSEDNRTKDRLLFEVFK